MIRVLSRRRSAELAWVRGRIGQVLRLMSAASAIRTLVRRRAPVVDARIRGAPGVFRLRPRTTDIDCLEKVFIRNEYGLPLPTAPRVIVDAGANIGAASVYFAHRFPGARIVALEPETSNFDLLRWNCRQLRRIIPIQAALWWKSERLALKDDCAAKWAFSVRPHSGSGSEIRGLTVDELMSEFNLEKIDLLKMDIEGAEKEIFERGDVQWLDQVDMIAIELHDWCRPGCSEALYSALHGRHFNQQVCGENVFIRISDAA